MPARPVEHPRSLQTHRPRSKGRRCAYMNAYITYLHTHMLHARAYIHTSAIQYTPALSHRAASNRARRASVNKFSDQIIGSNVQIKVPVECSNSSRMFQSMSGSNENVRIECQDRMSGSNALMECSDRMSDRMFRSRYSMSGKKNVLSYRAERRHVVDQLQKSSVMSTSRIQANVRTCSCNDWYTMRLLCTWVLIRA